MVQPANAYAVLLQANRSGKGHHLIWRTLEDEAMVDLQSEPARSAWQKLMAGLLSLLPLDSEL
jgi:hypothetical protein